MGELSRSSGDGGEAVSTVSGEEGGEAVATLSGSGVSLASSVPTTVRSISVDQVAAPQLNFWAPQLRQLHELGFDDERACVEILERLQAANIGVGSFDEITVQQVVNELLKNAYVVRSCSCEPFGLCVMPNRRISSDLL